MSKWNIQSRDSNSISRSNIRSGDTNSISRYWFGLEIVIGCADRIFDLEILIWSAHWIFDLGILIHSADQIFDFEILIRCTNVISLMDVVLNLVFRTSYYIYFKLLMILFSSQWCLLKAAFLRKTMLVVIYAKILHYSFIPTIYENFKSVF